MPTLFKIKSMSTCCPTHHLRQKERKVIVFYSLTCESKIILLSPWDLIGHAEEFDDNNESFVHNVSVLRPTKTVVILFSQIKTKCLINFNNICSLKFIILW
jgi:hypothetical protein